MDQIKTTETIVINGTDSWENLGEVTIYETYANARHETSLRPCGSVPLFFKHVPGLGNRFAIVYNEKIYALVRNNNSFKFKDTHNVYIPAIDRYLNIEEFNNQ